MKRAVIFMGTIFLPATNALALPRFAARNSMECIQCHTNPTGGGVRNDWGADVFEKVWLPLSRSPASWIQPDGEAARDDGTAESAPADDDSIGSFSGSIFEWLRIGGDFRTAYIWSRPDEGRTPDVEPELLSSFFLMQADLYHAARLNPHVTFVLDVGVYSGFEAWGLIRPFVGDGDFDVYFKVGRFIPPFGIRDVEHQLFTREGVGLGAADRDTGIEVSAYLGPMTLHVALTNGTLGDTFFDTGGTKRRTFEKAVSSRLSVRSILGPLRLQVGGSFSFNQDYMQLNPIFTGQVPSTLSDKVTLGLDETRAGAFLSGNLGRFTYLADWVWVQDKLYEDGSAPYRGYASYQELSFVAMQGLEFILTHEFMDPNVNFLKNTSHRVGAVVELFPLPFTELRFMVRRRFGDRAAMAVTDMVAFVHLFL